MAALAKDIRCRCSTVIEELRIIGDGDITSGVHLLPSIRAATIQCYEGNCSHCPHESLVCPGIGGVGDRWYKSKFLLTHGIQPLKLTDNDRTLFETILEVRLSEQAVRSVASQTSTQKCEAFNQVTLSTMPKAINRSRNFAGVLASKTLHLNNSLKDSVDRKLAKITTHTLSLKPSRYLLTTLKRERRQQKYKKTQKYKTWRHTNRAKLEDKYHRARNDGPQNVDEYKKGQLDDLGV